MMPDLPESPAVAPAIATACELPPLIEQTWQTLEVIARLVEPLAAERDAGIGADDLHAMRQGLAQALVDVRRAGQAATLLQQYDTSTPRTEVLARQGALAAARQQAVPPLLQCCGSLAVASHTLLTTLQRLEQTRAEAGLSPRSVDGRLALAALSDGILLGGACVTSFTLSLVQMVPLDLPYMKWFSVCSAAMLLVLMSGAADEPPPAGTRLQQARLLSESCAALRDACGRGLSPEAGRSPPVRLHTG